MDMDDWARWHAGHERRRASPHGMLAITGMHWLSEAPQRFDDVPGAWSVTADGVRVTLSEGERLTAGDLEITGTHAFGKVDEEGVTAAFGEAIAEIARRGSGVVLRPRHPSSQRLISYEGTPTFPPHERWLVPARFVPFAGPREVTLSTVVDGLTGEEEALGRVEFEIDGVPLDLI